MLRKTLLVCVGLLFLVAGTGYAQSPEQQIVAKGGKKMTGADLKELFGKPFTYEFQMIGNVNFWGINDISPNGTAATEWHDGGNQGDDTGTWSIKEDKFCVVWVRTKGAERCTTWYRISTTQLGGLTPDGKIGIWISIKP